MNEHHKNFRIEFRSDYDESTIIIIDEKDNYMNLMVQGEEALNKLIEQLELFRGKLV